MFHASYYSLSDFMPHKLCALLPRKFFIKLFSQSSFNRESAVDVDFEKAEEERWKRHSYAANETQQSSDDVFDNPRLVLMSISRVILQ